MEKLLPLLLLSVLVFGCKSGDDPVEEITTKTLFTYTSDLGNTSVSEQWIIVRNSDTGDLIDAKQVVKNVALVFESVKVTSDKLSITRLKISEDKKFIAADVYNGIDVGSIWTEITAEEDVKTEGNVVGHYSITLSSVPQIYNYALGDGVNNISGYLTSSGSMLTGNVTIGANARKHLFSVYPVTGNPVYDHFDHVSDNANYVLPYTSLKPYDKILNVKFPEGIVPQGDIQAIEDGYYYSLFSGIYFINELPTDMSEANFGFLNAYDNYYVRLYFDEFGYFSRGPAPTEIDYVAGSRFTVTDNSIDKFSATASHEYSFRSVHYIYDAPDDNIDFDITYYDPSPGAKHNDPFTPELISKYSIPLDQVKFESATFMVGGATYEEWQKYYFDKDTPKVISVASVTKH